jgi:hypothetical protein
VIEGLGAGEKVIVSGYENFGKNEVLNLRPLTESRMDSIKMPIPAWERLEYALV